MTKNIYSPGYLYHDGIGIWVDETTGYPARTGNEMTDNLVLVEATVYDNITEANGRQEVLTALRTLQAENKRLRTLVSDATVYFSFNQPHLQGWLKRAEAELAGTK